MMQDEIMKEWKKWIERKADKKKLGKEMDKGVKGEY